MAEKARIARENHPGGGDVVGFRQVPIVGNGDAGKADLLRAGRNHRLQIQVAAGNVEDQDSVGLEMAQVNLKRLASEQVHRNGVAGKRIEHQDIEVLGPALQSHALQHQASVSHIDVLVGGTGRVKGELVISHLRNQRIDLVIMQRIAGAGERGSHAGAQAQNAEADGTVVFLGSDAAVDAGTGAEIGGRDAAGVGNFELGSVIDGAIDQRALAGIIRAGVGWIVAGAQDSVEVADGKAVVMQVYDLQLEEVAG